MKAVIQSHEALAVGIEAVRFTVRGEYGVMIAPFPVLCFMVDRPAFHLDLADRKVALEVGHIVIGVP
jgi:hypothetical protein